MPINLDVANLIIFISENGENKSLKKSQIVCVVFVFHSLGGKKKVNRQVAKIAKLPIAKKTKKIKIKFQCFHNWKKVLGS